MLRSSIPTKEFGRWRNVYSPIVAPMISRTWSRTSSGRSTVFVARRGSYAVASCNLYCILFAEISSTTNSVSSSVHTFTVGLTQLIKSGLSNEVRANYSNHRVGAIDLCIKNAIIGVQEQNTYAQTERERRPTRRSAQASPGVAGFWLLSQRSGTAHWLQSKFGDALA